MFWLCTCNALCQKWNPPTIFICTPSMMHRFVWLVIITFSHRYLLLPPLQYFFLLMSCGDITKLPSVVVLAVLSEWLTIENVVRTDTAFCGDSFRNWFLSILEFYYYGVDLGNYMCLCETTFIRWVHLRKIKLTRLILDFLSTGDGKCRYPLDLSKLDYLCINECDVNADISNETGTDNVIDIINTCPKLSALRLADNDLWVNNRFHRISPAVCANLIQFDFSTIDKVQTDIYPTLAARCTQLRHLRCIFVGELEPLVEVFRSNPHMQSVDISLQQGDDAPVLQALMQAYSSMVSVRVHQLSRSSESSAALVKQLLAHFAGSIQLFEVPGFILFSQSPQCTRRSLSLECHGLSNDDLGGWLAVAPEPEELSLAFRHVMHQHPPQIQHAYVAWQDSNAVAHLIAESCGNTLQMLDLNRTCFQFMDLLALVAHCARLSTLVVQNNCQFTHYEMAVLKKLRPALNIVVSFDERGVFDAAPLFVTTA